MSRLFTFLLMTLLGSVMNLSAQMFTPVKWSTSVKMTDDVNGVIVMTASVDRGWHVYSNDLDPSVGPTPLSISWDKLDGVKLKGNWKPSKAAHREYDNMFEAELSWWTGSVELRQPFTATKDKFTIEGTIRYSACNDQNCIPPSQESFTLSGTAKVKNPVKEEEPAVVEEIVSAVDTVAIAPVDTLALRAQATDSVAVAGDSLWAPVDFNDEGNDSGADTTSLWVIFFTCFLGGFVALLTPCVWPMIPLTVSSSSRKVSQGPSRL